jgi:FtsX-like permease family
VPRGVLAWPGLSGIIDVEVSVKPAETVGGRVWVESAKAGLIKRSKVRAVERQGSELLYTRQGYAAFRIAVADLSYVAPVKAELESQGIRVLAETGRIEEIKFLDQQLGKIFSIFAAVSGVGAITCLLAIAYSSAERKKRSLAFLQIMGATRAQAARFPLYQCIFLTVCGALLAWAGNYLFATAVNAGFRARLERGENLSSLPLEAVVMAFVILLLIALLSFLVMIPRFVGMSLSEAAREP